MEATEQQTGLKPYVMQNVGDAAQAAQTPGMVRQPAILPGSGDTTKIWMGKVTAGTPGKGPAAHPPGGGDRGLRASGPRACTVRGRTSRSRSRQGPATFCSYRPTLRTSRENPYDEEMVAILCRAPDNLVQNL